MSVKSDLLNLEEERWEQLNRLLDKISDWEMPGVCDEWCVKDLLAHFAAWHATSIDRLEQFQSSGRLGPHPEDIDAFNAKVWEENKDLSLHDVKVMSGASRHRFREEVAALKEEDAKKFERMIFGNAHGHYEEHIPQLESYLDRADA